MRSGDVVEEVCKVAAGTDADEAVVMDLKSDAFLVVIPGDDD